MSAPLTLLDWLCSELDKRLVGLPSDQARHRELCLQTNCWSIALDRFAAFGAQPFEPHPVYGPLDLFDFRLLLCAIDERKSKLERVAA